MLRRKLRIKKTVTSTEKIKLQDQRNNLYKRVAAFNKKAASFIPDAELILRHISGSKPQSGIIPEDSEDDYEDVPVEPPEHMTLLLPSSVKGTSSKFKTLAEKELNLCKAQLQDALKTLWVAIGYKSLLLRKKVHGANSVKEKELAWASVNVEEGKISR